MPKLVRRLRERAAARRRLPALPRRRDKAERSRRSRRRKAALALSAGVMGLNTAASVAQTEPTGTAQIQLDPSVRRHAALLRVSESMKEAMLQEEGARDTVYRDVAGYPTVGVGHLVAPEDGLKVGDRVSEDRILDFLEEDLGEAEAAVVRLVGDMPVNQHEFDALVDLAFNVGEGNLSPDNSPQLNQAIALRDYDGIARQLDYHYAGGDLARGLVYRSERRANIFLEGLYDDPREQA